MFTTTLTKLVGTIADSIANGDVFHLYEPLVGRTGYPYTPGLPILLAPFVAIGDHFHLLGDYFFTHRHPKMFLILGPAEALVRLRAYAFAHDMTASEVAWSVIERRLNLSEERDATGDDHRDGG